MKNKRWLPLLLALVLALSLLPLGAAAADAGEPDRITYHANGAAGTMAPSIADENGNVTISANGFTAPAGCRFNDWNTRADGQGRRYLPGARQQITNNLDLYAQWLATSGSCNAAETVVWSLSEDGLLTIAGNGAVETAPWKSLPGSQNLILSVVIGDGVQSISSRAFEHCFAMTSVIIPASVENIAERAFMDCGELDIFYAGSKSEWDSIVASGTTFASTSCNVTYDYESASPIDADSLSVAHSVTVATVADGAASASMSSACAGNTVTVLVFPVKGYQTESVAVTDRNGNTVPVTDNADGSCSFVMPALSVTVTPVFIPEKEPDCPRDETCPLAAFSDMTPTDWYHDGVHYVLTEGIMTGTGPDTFDPNGAATRAMVVTMLWRMADKPVVTGECTFTDVDMTSWYADAVLWAVTTGVVNGTSETTFSPDSPITREQLSTILYRYAQTQGKGFRGSWSIRLDYPDAAQVSEWAYEPLCWMTMNGIIQGLSDGTLAPQASATRAQIATMFQRFCTLGET